MPPDEARQAPKAQSYVDLYPWYPSPLLDLYSAWYKYETTLKPLEKRLAAVRESFRREQAPEGLAELFDTTKERKVGYLRLARLSALWAPLGGVFMQYAPLVREGSAFPEWAAVQDYFHSFAFANIVRFLLDTAAFFCVILLGWATWRMSRLLKRTASEELRRDPGRPVLFLRSFGDDELAPSGDNREYLHALEKVPAIEELIAREARKYGPFIAVLDPRRSLPNLGAAKQSLPDSDWKSGVTKLIDAARLVILMPGRTKGVAWEIEQACRPEATQKLIILMPDREDCRPELGAIYRMLEHTHPTSAWLLDETAEANAQVIAIHFRPGGELVQLVAPRRSVLWYHAALRVALADILCGPDTVANALWEAKGTKGEPRPKPTG